MAQDVYAFAIYGELQCRAFAKYCKIMQFGPIWTEYYDMLEIAWVWLKGEKYKHELYKGHEDDFFIRGMIAFRHRNEKDAEKWFMNRGFNAKISSHTLFFYPHVICNALCVKEKKKAGIYYSYFDKNGRDLRTEVTRALSGRPDEKIIWDKELRCWQLQKILIEF